MILLESLWSEVVSRPVVALVLSISAALGSAAGGLRLFNAAGEWQRNRYTQRLADEMELSTGVSSFTAEDISIAQRHYIEPSCTQTDPSDEDDLSHVVALADLFDTIDGHFAEGGEKRHVIVLADSGMGKTSFCINYFVRETKKRKSKRRPVVIIPLGRGDAIRQINAVQNKRESVCFLDAFDEDPTAIGNQHGRLVELMTAAADFRNIVLTCRSQFFSDDKSIPTGSGIMYAAPRRAGIGREFPLHRLFLAPFSKRQVDRYLRSHFGFTSLANWKQRRAAKALVSSVPELSARPMLLELLPHLVRENKSIEQLFGLYEYLIEKWLQRERDWIAEEDLLSISIEIAVILFLQQRRGEGDRISPDRLDELASAHDHPLASWKLKSRSLLNRDIQGFFKFAHRSVLEYLVVVAALNGDERCLTVEWTDLMKDLLVSRGNTQERGSSEAVTLFLSSDHSATGIFPLASPVKPPHLRSFSECKKALSNDRISHRQSRRIPLDWRNAQLITRRISSAISVHAYQIEDPTHALVWHMIDISTSSELDIYRDTYTIATLGGITTDGTIPQRIERRNRLPSIEEMITLWESEPYVVQKFGVQSVLSQQEIYWLGDTVDTGPICASFDMQPREEPYLQLFASREGKGRSMHIYGFLGRYGLVNRKPFAAMAVYVSDAGTSSREWGSGSLFDRATLEQVRY